MLGWVSAPGAAVGSEIECVCMCECIDRSLLRNEGALLFGKRGVGRVGHVAAARAGVGR